MDEKSFILYLSGESIKNDHFIGLKEVPVEIMQKYEELLVFNLKFMLTNYPEKIIDLFNLEIEYINKLLERELNNNLNMAIEAGLKTAQKTEDDVMAVIYIIGYLNEVNQLIFKHVLEKKLKEKNIYFHISLIKTAEKFFGQSCKDWHQKSVDEEKSPQKGIIFCTKGKNFPDGTDKSIN